MPFLDDAKPAGLAPMGAPELDIDVPMPPIGKLFDAALKRETTVGSIAERFSQRSMSPPDASFDPWGNIQGYEDYASSFSDANSADDVSLIKRRIDKERRRIDLLDSGGAMGAVADTIVGFADPINMIPIGGQMVMVGRAGVRALSGAARVGTAGLLSGVASEAILQGTQETRTLTESAVNVAAQTLLSGILGGAVGTMTGHDLSALSRGMMRDTETVAADMEANIPTGGGNLGAAAARQTTIEDETIASAGGLEKVLEGTAPTLRTAASPALNTRTLAQELAEQPLMTKGNLEGNASPIAAESLIRQYQYPLAKGLSDIDNIFVEYRTGRAPQTGDLAKIGATDILRLQSEKLTRDQFMEAVGRAMRRNDESDIPEVAQAAKQLRATIFNPLKDRAIELGLLPEDVDPGTAASYLMRSYNYEKIAAERNRFSNIITDWYAGEQAKKAQIQSELAGYITDRDRLQADIAKLEKQIEGRERTLEKVQARQEEVSAFNQFAYRRSAAMTEPLDDLKAQAESLQRAIEPELRRLQEIAEGIAAEKDKYPQIRELDAAMFKLIGVGQKIKQGEDMIDAVDALQEFSEALNRTRGGVAEGIKSVKTARQAAVSMLPDNTFRELETARKKIGKEIRTQRRALQRVRKQYAATRKRNIGRAQGGAVFETKIRARGNVLADQASGKGYARDALAESLERKAAQLEKAQSEIERLIDSWEGKSAQGAKGAIGRRNKKEAARQAGATIGIEPPKAGRLSEADKAVSQAAQRIMNANTRLERQELQDIARQTIDRILGTPVGRLAYDVQTPSPGFMRADETPDLLAGPLKQRVFMIPDELIEDFLESDASVIARTYTRTMAPDVVLAERGWLNVEEKIKPILEEYEQLRMKTNDPKKLAALQKRMDADIRDIKAIYDRLRGTYGMPSNPHSLASRTFRVIRDLNYMRLLGGMTLASLPDVGRIVMQHGISRVFEQGIAPMVRNMRTVKLAANEVKMAGEALDMVLDSRAMSIADIMDDYGRYSKFERGLQKATGRFGMVTLMAPWNTALKQLTGIISQTRSLKAIEDLTYGTITKSERARLAQFGIDEDYARRIGEQFKQHGAKEGNIWWANTDAWTDRGAAEAYRAALSKEINQVIVTPGQEKPLWMSTELGKILGQFKSFSLASMQRVTLAGLQKRDMATLNGAALMVGLGMLSYYLRIDSEKLSDNPAVWIKEGVDRSGLTGWMFDANNMIEKMTRGAFGVSRLVGGPMSTRYASRGVLEAILGPTAGLVNDTAQITGSAATGDWRESDTRAARRMLPLQNLIGWKHAVDEAEAGLNEYFGVPR